MPIDKTIIPAVADREDFLLSKITPLAGGSINKVFLLETSMGKQVIKLNDTTRFPGMFKAEREGLQELKLSKTVDIPEVYGTGEMNGIAYLLLEYKKGGEQSPGFWGQFGKELAALHRTTAAYFGFPSSNYIGSLPQFNRSRGSASEFYVSQRLEPQLKTAFDNGYSFKNTERVLQNIAGYIPEEPPALIHGDLWSGNYLVNQQGQPCLIDPAVSYGPREMDLAMMKLFGGFPEEAFSTYFSAFPVQPDFEERIPLWQLYYLLVHLNIFGRSYLPQVESIFNRLV